MQREKENNRDSKNQQEKLKEQLENYVADIKILRREICAIKELINQLEIFGLFPKNSEKNTSENYIPSVEKKNAVEERVNDIFVDIGKELLAMEIYGNSIDGMRNKILAFDSFIKTLEERATVIYNQIEMLIEKTKELEKRR